MFRWAGAVRPMRSRRPCCFSPPTTAATSRARNCVWTAASHKCEPRTAQGILEGTTMGKLAGKNLLITGGNSGIGLAAAQEFYREGARVAICGLNERTLQAAKESLGARSLAVRADVSNLTDLDTMFATIKREFGHLDGVFVNAVTVNSCPSKR